MNNAFFSTEAGKEYREYNSNLKKGVLSFLPKKQICNDINSLGINGNWTYRGKTYNVIPKKDRQIKIARAQICNSKRSSAIVLLISFIMISISLIIFISSYFSAWQTFNEITIQWNIASYFFIGGVLLAIFYYIMWRNDNKVLKQLDKK